MRYGWVMGLCLLANIAIAGKFDAATGAEQRANAYQVEGLADVLDLFKQLQYTDDFWAKGHRDVPRVYFAGVPEQWSKEVSKEVEVTLKKRLFFRAVGPLVLRSNELIMADRKRLLALQKKQEQGAIDTKDSEWLTEIAAKYKLDSAKMSQEQLLKRLLKRVDVIPVSLILAQAAEESGWGTSRFAFQGNALFGQWTWSGKGITPEGQREGMGNYQIAAFDAPFQSVQAHAMNLNTHAAYEPFRAMREKKHAAGKLLKGVDAATTLTKYSERGEDYVKSLQSIIRYNKLGTTDEAYLRPMHAIVLVQ